jgi:Fic family protein
MKMNFEKLDALKEKLDGFRPLSSEVLSNLHEDLVLQWTYNSNAIEGNTLTLKETKVALEGITVGGKTLREHFEAVNHKEAILFVEDLVKTGELLNERDIKLIHNLVLKNIDDINAGVYRGCNVTISGAEHRPPEFLKVPEEMERFINWYLSEGQKLHPVERAAMVHGEFVKIHPFVDGNGRTSRLLMNLELMKAGYPAAVLSVNKRLEYYEALDSAHCSGNYGPFIHLISDVVEASFEPYWWALGEQGV